MPFFALSNLSNHSKLPNSTNNFALFIVNLCDIMPPKKKNIKPNDTVNDEEAEITPVANVNLATLQSSLEALIDNRM